MNAAQLAELNGLLAVAAEAQTVAGDARDKAAIADELLADAELPDLRPVNERIARRIVQLQRRRAV